MADVTLNITIPDAVVSRVQEALDATNKAEAEAWVKQNIKNTVIGYETNRAYEEAKAGVETARQAQQDARRIAHETAIADISL